MPRKFYTDIDLNSVARIRNLPAPELPSDAVPKEFVVNLVNNVSEGIVWKQPAKIAATTNIDLASPGTTIDGITLTAGNRILLFKQTDDTENGIYTFNTDTTPLSRSDDASTFAELKQAVITVLDGSYSGKSYRQTETAGVIGTDPINFIDFGVVTPIATQSEVNTNTGGQKVVTSDILNSFSKIAKYTEIIGDGSTTTFVITHNLGTEDTQVIVKEVSGNKSEIYPEIRYTSSNTITLVFATAPSTNSLKVVVTQ